MNNNPTDETYTYIDPDFEQVDNLIERAFDDCTQHFHRFNDKCDFVVKFNHAPHDSKNYFTLRNDFLESIRRSK